MNPDAIGFTKMDTTTRLYKITIKQEERAGQHPYYLTANNAGDAMQKYSETEGIQFPDGDFVIYVEEIASSEDGYWID